MFNLVGLKKANKHYKMAKSLMLIICILSLFVQSCFQIETEEESDEYAENEGVEPVEPVGDDNPPKTLKQTQAVTFNIGSDDEYSSDDETNSPEREEDTKNLTALGIPEVDKSPSGKKLVPHSLTEIGPKKINELLVKKPKLNISEQRNYNETIHLAQSNEFYNLEPAAGHVRLKGNSADYSDYNTWYVPEMYPCWNLPILHANYIIRNYSKVFHLYPALLKDVKLDTSMKEEENIGKHNFDFRSNKWCSMAPCYGDHVLCLYTKNENSIDCHKKYKVNTLTFWEQLAFINTLNSMRNHVARGSETEYPFLPAAANMKQILYDNDLQVMAERWIRQCLPGPAPCSALDDLYVAQLECSKMAKQCCTTDEYRDKNCTPDIECSVHPVIGCLHEWFWSVYAHNISLNDVKCGHIEAWTYHFAQLIWAKTFKVGCAYGVRPNGDARVICNFAPGAHFLLRKKYFCGLISYDYRDRDLIGNGDVMDDDFLRGMGIDLTELKVRPKYHANREYEEVKLDLPFQDTWGLSSLVASYKENLARKIMGDFSNGTISRVARLVTRYQFHEELDARCDSDEPIYVIGKPGSLCAETGRKFGALCFEFRDPTPGYRAVAIVASIALFSLILYDLFSGVMRQLSS